jgi:hypothetical protein
MKAMLWMPMMALLVLGTSAAENIVFPADAGIVNVRERFGAKGDGVTDDTAALQQAFDELMGRNELLYFPNGTYRVSAPVGIFGGKAHSRTRFMNLQGQSRDGVIIRLTDNAPGFQDAKNPKIVLSLYEGASTGDAMHTYARNFTIDVGRGNPGAVGLRYLSNNTGAVYDVLIRSSDPNGAGAIGLDLRQSQQGPCLIKRVSIEGFDTGIEAGNSFAIVFEHIRLKNQNVVGFHNRVARVTMRGLTSENRVPAIRAEKNAHLTLIEGVFTGGEAPAAAIELETGKVFLRDLKQSGYGRFVRAASGPGVEGEEIDEWHPLPAQSLFGAPARSLRLPIEETPEIPWETDPAKWRKVEPATAENPHTLQAAIDAAAAAGQTTIYFPRGVAREAYVVRRPVRVHGSVNRIIGMNNILWIDGDSPDLPPGAVVFTFEDLRGPVVLERFFNILKYKGWKGLRDRYLFETKSEHPVVVRNLAHGACLHNKPSPGRVWFGEDVTGHVRVGKDEKVWLRQYNPESPDDDMCTVDGGQVWILGMKTEGRARHIVARNGARVELLGGVSYQSWRNQPLDPPMFTVVDAEASFTFGFYHWQLPFTTIVEETRGGETRTLPRQGMPGYHLPLYRAGAADNEASAP